jgi:hypothetical protein
LKAGEYNGKRPETAARLAEKARCVFGAAVHRSTVGAGLLAMAD